MAIRAPKGSRSGVVAGCAARSRERRRMDPVSPARYLLRTRRRAITLAGCRTPVLRRRRNGAGPIHAVGFGGQVDGKSRRTLESLKRDPALHPDARVERAARAGIENRLVEGGGVPLVCQIPL